VLRYEISDAPIIFQARVTLHRQTVNVMNSSTADAVTRIGVLTYAHYDGR
jgi:hypothetical protein